MANLTETPTWEDGIYLLEEDDLVKGGADGIDNVQAKQLANRTRFLKDLIDSLGISNPAAAATLAALAALAGSADKIAYFTGQNSTALTSFSAFARTLVAASDAATARGVIGAVTQDDINTAVAALLDSSPAALNTLNELAAALGDDANFAATVNAAIALRLTQEQGDARYALRSALVAYAQLAVAQQWTKGQRGAETALPVTTGTVTIDLEQSNNWGGTLTGNITLANPSSMPVGQSGVIRIVNGATPYTIAYGSYWKPADGAMFPALTALAAANDDLVYYVESATRIIVGRVGGSV